jgi:FlaA1/EpsC-like NDP-sugar epimerase
MKESNGFSPRLFKSYFFAFVDGLLVISALILADILSFGKTESLFGIGHTVEKLMLLVSVIQITFYYFDLYEPRNYREKIGMAILLLKSLGISFVVLALIYYAIPILTIGRGMLAVSFSAIFFIAILWRTIYPWITSKKIFKERILIVGNGFLAQRIQDEILNNFSDSYQIVGYIDEGENGNARLPHYREFQPDLFHLQNEGN